MNKVIGLGQIVRNRFYIYAELSKLRLSSFVILSSIIGYLFANIGFPIDWIKLCLFAIGGSFVTFASNAINQVIEKESDKLMMRTMARPLPMNRISTMESILIIGILSVLGICILSIALNPMTGVIAAISLLLYGFVYTPMKRISSLAVFVGAIPGAFPPLLGYVAYSNQIDQTAIWLFLIQFFWQFPHFWSIAWLSYDDYLKADIMLLPSAEGKSKQSAFITLIYTLALIPLSFYPYFVSHKMSLGIVILLLASIVFSYLAYNLYQNLDDKSARKLMFGSFVYLLVFLLSLFFN